MGAAGDIQHPVLLCEAALVLGYVLGSIPFGLLITNAAGLGDIRKTGSGNIGATNVLRTGKYWAAAATLLCDAGKGAAAVLIARDFGGDFAAICAGLGAFLGHLYPVWLNFEGGKGVATFIGVTLALSWPVGLMTCLTWLGAAVLWRMSSLAALIAAAATPAYLVFWKHSLFSIFMLVLAALIFYAHRENISRILNGEEPKIGGSAKGTA